MAPLSSLVRQISPLMDLTGNVASHSSLNYGSIEISLLVENVSLAVKLCLTNHEIFGWLSH